MDNCARFLSQNVNFQREITVALFAKNKRRGGGGAGGGVAYFKTEGGENCSDGDEDDV